MACDAPHPPDDTRGGEGGSRSRRKVDQREAAVNALEPLLPRSGRGGQWRDHRQVLNGVFWRARTGAPWRDVPARYGPWQTLYERFSRWRADGTWVHLVAAVRADAALADLLDLDLFHLDSSNVRASRAAAGARKRGSGGGAGRPRARALSWGLR